MLRMGTYGPDLLDEKGAMPEYRQRVEDVITPKFAVSFEKEAATAEQIVAQAEISRQASVFATGVSAIDRGLRDRPGRRGVHRQLPQDRRAGADALPDRGQPREGQGRWLVDNFTPVTGAPQ